MNVILWTALLALAAPDSPPVEPAPDCEGDDCPEVVVESAGPDRSAPPTVVPADWMTHQEAEVHQLGPGQTAYFVHVPGVRDVGVEVVVHHGYLDLYGEVNELGIGVGQYMDTSTASHSAQDLEVASDLTDMSLTSWGSHHAEGVDLSVPPEDLSTGLSLMAEMLHEPSYNQKDVSQMQRDRELYFTLQGPANLGVVAQFASAYSWFPKGHPYAHPPNIKDMKLKAKDLIAGQAAWRTSGPLTVLVVGDVEWADVEAPIKAAIDGLGTPGERSPRLKPEPPAKDVFLAVDMPGQEQSALRLRMAAPIEYSEDETPYYILNWALGGHFLSRMNANLREDKGFTYGSGSRYVRNQGYAYNDLVVDVKVENTAAAVREIEHEVDLLVADGITQNELDMGVRSRVSDWNSALQSGSSSTGFYSGLLFDQRTVEQAAQSNADLEAVTPADTQEMAVKWMSPDLARQWVVVGDRKQLEAQFQELGWTVQWITAHQAVFGDW